MNSDTQRRRFRVFVLISFLVVAQVAWWTALFVQNVEEIKTLRLENHALSEKIGKAAPESPELISQWSSHRKSMFVSESIFFLMLTGAGLFLLFRALRFDEKAHETQKNFIEILAHESKTPLTSLKLRLESLLEGQVSQATCEELAAGIEEVRRLTSIVEKTLNLNRMERQELLKELVCVADVIRDLVRRLEPFFRSHGVELDLRLDSEACVLGDVDGLRNSFQSVIENSVLYNEKSKKSVQVQLTEDAGSLSVRFSDNGPGISPHDEVRIFEKFYRGKSRSKTSGTGLGLYIARYIIKAHRGDIRLLPASMGAVFEIKIPVSA